MPPCPSAAATAVAQLTNTRPRTGRPDDKLVRKAPDSAADILWSDDMPVAAPTIEGAFASSCASPSCRANAVW